jgi:hypothetical protein
MVEGQTIESTTTCGRVPDDLQLAAHGLRPRTDRRRLPAVDAFDAGFVFDFLVTFVVDLDQFEAVLFGKPGADDPQARIRAAAAESTAGEPFGDVYDRVLKSQPGRAFVSAGDRFAAQKVGQRLFDEEPDVFVQAPEPPRQSLEVAEILG